MTEIKWSILKNERLKRTRGVSFEEILGARLIGVKKHPARKNQRIMLFKHKGYVWIVPYIIEGDCIFLKTLFPSRKYTREYIGRESSDEKY